MQNTMASSPLPPGGGTDCFPTKVKGRVYFAVTRGLEKCLTNYFNLKDLAIRSVWFRMRPNLSRRPLNLSV